MFEFNKTKFKKVSTVTVRRESFLLCEFYGTREERLITAGWGIVGRGMLKNRWRGAKGCLKSEGWGRDA